MHTIKQTMYVHCAMCIVLSTTKRVFLANKHVGRLQVPPEIFFFLHCLLFTLKYTWQTAHNFCTVVRLLTRLPRIKLQGWTQLTGFPHVLITSCPHSIEKMFSENKAISYLLKIFSIIAYAWLNQVILKSEGTSMRWFLRGICSQINI